MKSVWVCSGVLLLALLATFGWLVRGDDPVAPALSGPDGAAARGAVSGVAREAGSDTASAPVEREVAVAPAEAKTDGEGSTASDLLPLTGVVSYPDGSPASGALVQAMRNAWREFSNIDPDLVQEPERLAEERTDEDGRFQLLLAPQTPVDLVVRAPGYAGVTKPNRFGGENIHVRLQQGAHLFGRVTRAKDGLPVAGARISGGTFGSPVLETFEGTTNEDGAYSFAQVPPGNVQVELISPPHKMVRAQIQLEPGQSVQQDFTLAAGITILGRVTDSLTGKPIPGAELSHGWTFERTTTSGPDGRYALEGFGASGTYDVHVRAAGYGRTESGDLEIDPELEEFTLDFELEPARRASGRVLDPSGQPLAGAYVAAVANEFDRGRKSAAWWSSGTQKSDWQSAWSDDEGRFLIVDLRPDARHSLFVRAEGLGVAVFDFPAGEFDLRTIDLGDLTLEHASVIFGLVVDEFQRPVAETRVTMNGHGRSRLSLSGQQEPWFEGYVDERETITDAEGRFRFRQVAPGEYTLTAGRRNENESEPVTISILAPGQLEEVRLMTTLGLAIAGRVLDPEGAPAAGTLVLVQDEAGGVGGMTVARADGTFRIDGFEPGAYTVRANPTAQPAGEAGGPQVRQTSARGVPAGTPDLVLRLGRASTIEGQVVDAEGNPIARAIVAAVDENGARVASDLTEPTGRFALATPPGIVVRIEVQLTADSDDPKRAFVIREDRPPSVFDEVASGTTGLVLRVQDD